MKFPLIRELDSRRIEEWNARDVAGIEAELLRKLRLVLEVERRSCLIGTKRVGRRVEQIAWHPLELTFDLLAPHDAINRVDGGQLGVPDRLGVIAAKGVVQLAQHRIGYGCQMCGGEGGLAAETPLPIDERNVEPCALQEVRGRNSGDAGA